MTLTSVAAAGGGGGIGARPAVPPEKGEPEEATPSPHPPRPLKLQQPALLEAEDDAATEWDDSSIASPISVSGRGFGVETPRPAAEVDWK